MVEAVRMVKEFAIIAFVLLGVLFGMMIMTFIFGNLGKANTDQISDETVTILNNDNVYFNSSIFTISEVSDRNFSGGFTITSALNFSSGKTIASGNYTVDAGSGTVENSTVVAWDNVTINYTYLDKTELKVIIIVYYHARDLFDLKAIKCFIEVYLPL